MPFYTRTADLGKCIGQGTSIHWDEGCEQLMDERLCHGNLPANSKIKDVPENRFLGPCRYSNGFHGKRCKTANRRQL